MGKARSRTSSSSKSTAAKPERQPDGVATDEQNAKLSHSEGGTTTRDDALDVGVPMLPGSPKEPVGPEDALGVGEKRGDYRDRIVGEPHETVLAEDGGEPVTKWVDEETGAEAKEGAKGAVEVVVDRKPLYRVERQRPRADDIGDAEGIKGGVDTARAAA